MSDYLQILLDGKTASEGSGVFMLVSSETKGKSLPLPLYKLERVVLEGALMSFMMGRNAHC